jgi:hypothetical protein
MAISATDILLRLSGGASNSDVNLSIGGAMSTTTVITDNTLHNLFDKVTGAESTAGATEYRCFYVLNNHGSLTYQTAKIYIDSEDTHTGEDVEIGLDLAGVNGTADTIADAYTDPSPAVTFSDASGVGNALTIGNIPFGQYQAIWVKRVTTAATAAYDDYGIVIKVVGDTAA